MAELREVFELAESICETQDGPWAYMETLDKDRKILAAFKSADSYEDFYQAAMLTDSFARLSTKKQPDVDPDKKEQVKLLRTRVKDGLKKLGADYFENSIENLYSHVQALRWAGGYFVRYDSSFL